MAGNDAEGKAPTFEEQVAKFQGFSTQDGEISDGKGNSQADERREAEAAEARAGAANRSTHAENVARGTTTTEKTAAAAAAKTGGDNKAAEITLTDDEEEAALQALLVNGKTGDDLTQAEMEKAVADALAAKKAAAAPPQSRRERRAERFNENARVARTLERENQDLRTRLEALERGDKPLTTTKGAGNAADELVKPDHTDAAKYQYGELDAKYIADLARFETLKAIADSKKSEGTTEQTRRDAAAVAEFKERVDTFCEAGRDEFDDFDEVVTDTLNLPKDDPAAWPLSAMMGELLLESEHGRAIAYELASDPKEAKRIIKLSEARQAIWFGQREAALSSGKTDAKDPPQTKTAAAKPAAKESKAPVPLRTRLHGSGGNRVPNSATTDFAAFEAMQRSKR